MNVADVLLTENTAYRYNKNIAIFLSYNTY